MRIKKSQLRKHADTYGEKAIFSLVRGIFNETTERITLEE